MKEQRRKELMKKYNIKVVGGGRYGEGFFDCLDAIDNKYISLFRNDHVIIRIEFAQKNTLPLDWLKNQLRNDWKKKIGVKEDVCRT